MIRLRVTPGQALQALSTIRHDHCQQSISAHWHLDNDGNVRAQSILWLFCWAATGQRSEKAAQDAEEAFDLIFDHSYEWLSRRITLEVARSRRYAKSDIEGEFLDLIRDVQRNNDTNR